MKPERAWGCNYAHICIQQKAMFSRSASLWCAAAIFSRFGRIADLNALGVRTATAVEISGRWRRVCAAKLPKELEEADIKIGISFTASLFPAGPIYNLRPPK